MWQKFKGLLRDDTLFTAVVFTLSIIVAFGLGRLAERASVVASVTPSPPVASPVVTVDNPDAVLSATQPRPSVVVTEAVLPTSNQTVVASKNGTKYHFPWCPGAKQIKEENRRIFTSPADAEAAGYTRAANCKEF
jgi:hypothetical protein